MHQKFPATEDRRGVGSGSSGLSCFLVQVRHRLFRNIVDDISKDDARPLGALMVDKRRTRAVMANKNESPITVILLKDTIPAFRRCKGSIAIATRVTFRGNIPLV